MRANCWVARLVLHCPLKSRSVRITSWAWTLRTKVDSRLGNSEGKERRKVTGTAGAPGARGFPEPGAARPPPLPSLHSLPAPPHPAPSSLHERKWESQRRGPAETKHRSGRGGAALGWRPRNEAGPRGPALPSSPRPHSPAPESTRSPRPRSRAGREQQWHELHVQRLSGKTCSSRDSKSEAPGPFPRNRLRNSEPPPASQAPSGPGLQLPAGCAKQTLEATEAHEAQGSTTPQPALFYTLVTLSVRSYTSTTQGTGVLTRGGRDWTKGQACPSAHAYTVRFPRGKKRSN